MELTLNTENLNTNLLSNNYKEIELIYDESIKTLWVYMVGTPRPSFTPTLLKELKHLYKTLKYNSSILSNSHPVDYVVGASKYTDTFNLGGDLALFRRCVLSQDVDTLRDYAYSCLDIGFDNTRNLECDITTVSLLQGSAYGGGFEAALSCDVIVAEKGVKMGFPEILFNLFPGMGAYTYLARRVEPYFVEQMITSGRTYTADELFERGIIDVLAEPGEGVRELNDYIKKHSHQRHGHVAMQKARLRTYPVTLKELRDISDIWVDAALNLSSKDLKVMERLVRRQSKSPTKEPVIRVA